MNKITVGVGTPEQRDINIKSFVQSKFKDGRLISLFKLEDDSFLGLVENPLESQRNQRQEIWLSNESFIGFLSVCYLLSAHSNSDFGEMLKGAIESDNIDYIFSPDLHEVSS